MPWLRHGIMATVFGSLQSYLQSGGRLLRSCSLVGKRDVTVQDHGGNWWRHGSLNDDRVWRLDDTSRILANLRADTFSGDDGEPDPPPQPFVCPRCLVASTIRRGLVEALARCANCGLEFDWRRGARPVLQSDGVLSEHAGPLFRPRQVKRLPDTVDKWKKVYWQAKNSKTMTFGQAAGLFFQKHGYFPPRTLPMMPRERFDWYLAVSRVPFTALRNEEEG
jgi:hypothetical protein